MKFNKENLISRKYFTMVCPSCDNIISFKEDKVKGYLELYHKCNNPVCGWSKIKHE